MPSTEIRADRSATTRYGSRLFDKMRSNPALRVELDLKRPLEKKLLEILEVNLQDPRHLAEIIELNLEFVTESGVATDAGHGNRLEELLRSHPTLFAFLARNSDGQALGYALCHFTISSFAAKTVANIHDLYVRPDARSHGIARRLMESFESIARAKGCGRLSLEVNYDNTQAQSLYRKLGFSDGSKDRNGDGTWFWVKTLG